MGCQTLCDLAECHLLFLAFLALYLSLYIIIYVFLIEHKGLAIIEHLDLDGVAGLETILTYLLFAHIYIIRAWQVVIVCRAQESVAVRSTFQCAHSNYVFA